MTEGSKREEKTFMTVHEEDATPPSDDQLLLVAYLDGEIDGNGAQEVEQRLARDAEFRRTLNELQRSWDLLDDLPQPDADANFTKTTVEMVAVQVSHDVVTQQTHWQRSRTLKLAASLLVLAIFTGAAFFFTRYWLDAPNRAFVRDLPIIERIDVYEQIDDLQFLEKLAEEGLFNEELRDENAP